MAGRKKAPLGRNLDALLGRTRPAAARADDQGADERDSLQYLALDSIRPGRYQPRTGMDPERLEELADSIRAQGVVQPIVVRPLGSGKGYELIAGERRWRAARTAGLEKIPAVIREVPDEISLAMALIENIQRENLNPMEEAGALKRLIEEFELTHEQAARNVGRSRAAVTNLLRLLELAPEVRELVDRDLSVRQTEALVQRIKQGRPARPAKKAAARDPDIRRLETELTETLCAPVSLKHSPSGKGSLTIRYTSADELEGILERIRR